MLFCENKADVKLLLDSLPRSWIYCRRQKTLSNGAVATDWLIPTFCLILTQIHHGRFVLLTIGVVGDIARLMVARTIDPCPGEVFEPTFPSLRLSTNNTPKCRHNGLVLVVHINTSSHRLMIPLVSPLPLVEHLLRHLPFQLLPFRAVTRSHGCVSLARICSHFDDSAFFCMW